jgi:Insertion element 4 transposase N-terminal
VLDTAMAAAPAVPAARPSAGGALGRAFQTVVRMVKVAAGVFAPGHLGELTWHVPFELVDAVLAETGTTQRRLRDLPSRVGVYFVCGDQSWPRPGRTAFDTRRGRPGTVWGR